MWLNQRDAWLTLLLWNGCSLQAKDEHTPPPSCTSKGSSGTACELTCNTAPRGDVSSLCLTHEQLSEQALEAAGVGLWFPSLEGGCVTASYPLLGNKSAVTQCLKSFTSDCISPCCGSGIGTGILFHVISTKVPRSYSPGGWTGLEGPGELRS